MTSMMVMRVVNTMTMVMIHGAVVRGCDQEEEVEVEVEAEGETILAS